MKLGRIKVLGADGTVGRIVAVHPDERRVVDLALAEVLRLMSRGATESAARRYAAALFPESMSAAIALGDLFLESAKQADAMKGTEASLPIEKVTWLPATDPSVVRDCLTFPLHIKQVSERVGAKINPLIFEIPGYFKGPPSTVVGHDAEIPYPFYSEYLDYELEIGFVVGHAGHNLTPEEAEKCIFGLTVFNDFSARDRQGKEIPLGMGPQKSKDFAYGIGPWITTMDEFDGIDNLEMVARVNGEEWGRGVSKDMIWSPGELLAYISIGEQLQPGDLFGSGTVGNGSAFELGRRLNPGDVIELEISGVGVLRNRIGPAEKKRWWPTPRKNPFDTTA